MKIKKIKITEEELRKIITEEIATVIREADTASDEQVAEVAGTLGGLLVGQPEVAANVRDALSKRYPEAAKALYAAFNAAQQHLDMVYSSYDD